jgi:hypothetical protein
MNLEKIGSLLLTLQLARGSIESRLSAQLQRTTMPMLNQRCNQNNTQFVSTKMAKKYLMVEEPKGITLAIKEFFSRH